MVIYDAYFILGVTPEDSLEHITKEYRRKAKLLHPDKLSNSDSRNFHISALRQEAKKYEDVCQTAFLPCSDMGFLEYLSKNEPPIPSTSHTEAVSILTYHSSKGLEWPIVIMASLDKEVHERIVSKHVCGAFHSVGRFNSSSK